MTRRPTLHDVADRAGVSIKTVSRVVNGEASVNEEVRTRVTSAIAQMQYVPNSFARSLKAGTGDTIGVVIDTLADPFFAALAGAIEDRALTAGLNVIIGSTGFAPERERRQVERMAMQRVQALVLTPVAGSHRYLDQFRDTFPIVLVDRAFDIEGFDLVAVDDEGLGRQATEHLVKYGHRRIGFVGNDSRYPTATARLHGYLTALRTAGIEPKERWIGPGPTSDANAADVTATILSGLDAPTAILAASARASIGVLRHLHRAQRTDVAFISFGDLVLAEALTPQVTVVNQDPAAIGIAAIERVLAHLDARKRRTEDGGSTNLDTSARTILVHTPLIARGSGEVLPP